MVMRMGADFAGGAGITSSSMGVLKNNGYAKNLNGGTVPAPSQVSPGSLNGGSVPAPAQRAPSGPTYTPPPQQMVYQDPRITNPNDNWAQPLQQGGGGAPNDFAPPVDPGPVKGGREWYNSLDAGGQQAQDSSWLAGDSDYTAQVAEYDKALKSFVDRIANQRKGFTEDANLATASTQRNQDMSLNNLGEDFGARGLSYSGMFDTEKNNTNTRFNEAKSGIERIRSKNDTEAVNRESDYKAENAISKSNASRASLGRQAQRQALIDSGAF